MPEYLSGTEGRVLVGGLTSENAVGGLYNWTLETTTNIIKIPHFEGPTDALNRMWTQKLFGLSDGNGTLEGYFDIEPPASDDSTRFANGVAAVVVLIIEKGSNYGIALSVKIGNLRTQAAVENQPTKFTCTFEVEGIVPLSAIVA